MTTNFTGCLEVKPAVCLPRFVVCLLRVPGTYIYKQAYHGFIFNILQAMIQYVVHAVVQENSFDLTSKNLFMIASRCYVVLFSKVQNSWDKIRFAGFYAQALAQAIYLALLFSFPYEHKTLTRPEFLQNLMDTVCLSVSGMLGPRPMQNLWNSVGKRMLSRIQRWKIKHQILKWPLPSFAPSLELDAIHTPLPGLHPHEMSHRAPEPADKRTYINCRLNHSRFVQTYLMHTRRYKKSVKDWSLENFMFDRMVATKAADPPEPSVFSRASTETDSFEFAGDELRANNRLGYKRDVSQVFKSSGCAHYDGLSSENISLDPKNPLSYHLHSIHSALPRVKGAAPGKTPFRRDRCKPLGPHDSPYPWVVSKLRMRSSGRNLFSGFRDTQHEKKSMKAEPLHSSSPLLNTEEFYQDPLLATNHRKATAESLRKKSLSQKINRQNINEATMPSNSRRKDSVSSSVKSVFLTEFDSFLQQQGSYYDIHEKTAKERVEEMEKTGEITLLNMDDIDEERSDYFYLNAALKPPTNSHFHDRRRLLTSIHRGLQNTREEMEKNKKASRRRVRQGGIKISAEIDKIAQAKKVAMNSAKSVKENIAFVMFKRKQEEKDQAEQLSRVQKSLNDHRLW